MAIGRIPTITILGSINMDIMAYVARSPLAGETITATESKVTPGGKGANQAVACAKLSRASSWASDGACSAHVSMIGAVGDDAHGRALKDSLESAGVDTTKVSTVPECISGLALVTVDLHTCDNRIVVCPGANDTVSPQHFVLEKPETTPDLLIMQLEIPKETVLAVLVTAKKARIPVLLNPAPAQSLDDQVYKDLDYLVMNETETELLSGLSMDKDSNIRAAAEIFLKKGVRNVIITLGGQGVFYASHHGNTGLVPAVKCKVVDTTAAGDTFIGSLSHSIVQRRPEEAFDIEAALALANRAASKAVTRRGGQPSIPWRDEVELD